MVVLSNSADKSEVRINITGIINDNLRITLIILLVSHLK